MKFPRKFLAVPALTALMLVLAPLAMISPAWADGGNGNEVIQNGDMGIGISPHVSCNINTVDDSGVVTVHPRSCCFNVFEAWDGGWLGWNGSDWQLWDGLNWWMWNGTTWNWFWNGWFFPGSRDACARGPFNDLGIESYWWGVPIG